MKKIGFLSCSVGWGGLEMNVLKLARWLCERGWDVTLYLNENSRIYEESKKYNIHTQIIPNHKKYFDFSGAFQFSRTLKKHKITNIFVFDNRDLDFIFLTKKLLFNKLMVIYQQHMQIGINKNDFLHTLRFSAIDFWITPLNLLKKEVVEKTNMNLAKIRVIPLGTEIVQFIHPKYKKIEARDKLSLGNKAFLMGTIGRIDPKKGQLFVVQAIQKLKELKIDAELLIMGEPTINDPDSQRYFTSIKQYLVDHNITDKVHLRNFTNDINLFYNAVDVFILASDGETYGMVTIEAMLSKLPIIATNSAGTPEILNDGEFGLLYPHNDLDKFCDNITWIIQNSSESDMMATKAQTNAIEKYSHEHECRLIEELLNSVS